MSVGAGAQSLILNQIKSAGVNLIGVLPGASEEEGPPASVMGISITTLTYDNIEAVLKPGRALHIVAGASYVQGTATTSWYNRSIDTNFTGTTASYLSVEETDVVRGRFFTQEEEKNMARVAVLGSEVVDNLFSGADPIGQTIRIKKESFRVIGLMESRGTSGFQNLDNQIYLPLYTAQKLLLGINHITLARFRVDSAENIDQSMEDIKIVLREEHDIPDPSQDDFTVRSQLQAMDALNNVTNALKFFLAAIAAISLIVGGVGVMNIMLASVTERTREIGLRKAVGATKTDILSQILLETIAITLAGGIIGFIIGTLFSALVAAVMRYLAYEWDFVISLLSIVLGIGVSLAVGLVFGLAPAKRAADLHPIEALRHE